MKRTLLLSLTYSPDNVSTAQIMTGLAEDLGVVGVITTTPHYHRDPGMEAKQPLRWLIWPILRTSELNGVRVYHVPMPHKGIWAPLRMLSWIWFHAMSVLIAPFLPASEVIIACSPPLTIGLAAFAIGIVKRAKYIYNVQELYPDIAVNLGKMKGRWIIRFFEGVERFIYRHAAAVTSITEGMCAKIRSRTDPGKVHLIPNYVEIEETGGTAAPAKRGGRFVLCYAGNMGVPQNLGVMVEAADELEKDGRTPYPAAAYGVLFVGGGADEERLRAMSSSPLVEFRGYRPIGEMPAIYAESDLFYVGQDPQAASDGIPSKIYRILGQKKPLVVLTAPGSDLERFVEASGGGVIVHDAKELAAVMRTLAADPARAREMGEKGYEYVRSNYSRARISGMYRSLVDGLSAS